MPRPSRRPSSFALSSASPRSMPRSASLLLATILPLLLSLSLPAQIIETLGGTTTAPSGANRGKASLFRVDTTVALVEFEYYLDVPGPETLTFFSHRHHSRSGTATLEWTLPVTVAGGGGPAWYSTGPIFLPLVAGNHYTLGVSWAGNVTYYYTTAQTNAPVSFGSWQRAHTTGNPPPAALVLPATVDVAQYHQRLTTVPLPGVVDLTGVGCSTSAPRLVATAPFSINTTEALELVDTPPATIVLFALANGAALPVPLSLFGCDLWLDVAGGFVALAAVSDASGYSRLDIPVPNTPGLFGVHFSGQGIVFGTAIDFSNAVSFTIN